MRPAVRAAGLSVVSNTGLVAVKLVTGLAMGSVSVISEAIHSALDLVAALIALFSVREAARPPDETHAFGHGKIENVAALVEALLVFAAAGWIVLEAARKLLGAVRVEALGLGVAVMAGSALVNYLVSEHLYRVARETDSVALKGDAVHLRTDVYTSVGVAAGLAAIHFTGLTVLDPLIAIVVALLIVRVAWRLTREAFRPLLDVRLSDDEEARVREIVGSFAKEFVEFHKLRTRRAGPERHIDLHLVVHPDHAVSEVHELADRIETALREWWERTSVLIHIEPCRRAPDCDRCGNPCEPPPPTGSTS
ncbi:MAG: cation diffusion facilitator family transporter [Bacillota bacterium]